MKFLKQLFDFYINASLHIGIAIIAFIEVCSLHIKNPGDQTGGTIILGTIVGYNLLKFDIFRNPKILMSKFIFKPIAIFTIVCLVGFAYCFFAMRSNYQTMFIVPVFIGLIYPFLRKFAFLKIFLVAFCFTFVVVEINIIEVLIDRNVVTLFEAKLFFIIAALMIPFEIYDSQFDAETLQTIPQKYGIKTAKIIGIVFVLLSFFNFKNEMKDDVNLFICDVIIAIIIMLFIVFSSTKRSQYYTSFWVESVPIFWCLLIGCYKMYPYVIEMFSN